MIAISGKYGNLVYEPAEPEPEPARVVYHVDGKIYVEPGYYAPGGLKHSSPKMMPRNG